MGSLSRLLILFVCIIPKRWCLLPETNTHYTDPMWQKISRESRRYADISFLTFQFLSALLISILMLGALVLNKVSLVWLIGGTYINHSVRLEIWYVEDWPPYCNNSFKLNMYFEKIKLFNIWTRIFYHHRYAAFGLVLIVPEAVALIKVLWNTSFIKRTRTHQWPSGVALFVVCTKSISSQSAQKIQSTFRNFLCS